MNVQITTKVRNLFLISIHITYKIYVLSNHPKFHFLDDIIHYSSCSTIYYYYYDYNIRMSAIATAEK